MWTVSPLLILGFVMLSGNTLIQKGESFELLIGTYTGEGSEGIYRATFSTGVGQLSPPELLVETENPSFLAFSGDRSRLYAVNETQPGFVSVFEWNETGTELEQTQKISSEGDHPCFVEVNSENNLLAVANYSSGTIALYPLDADGEPTGAFQQATHNGDGPFLPNQASAHAHCARFGPGTNYLYAADLGADKIFGYHIDPTTGLEEQQVALQMKPGDGPRHIAFHPERPQLFVINELSSTIVSATIEETSGKLTQVDRKSTLPTFYKGQNYCADIHLSADGKFLYASNRGHNSIAVFSVSEEGMLTLLQTESVRGDWPRNFTISPDGKFVLVANQRSDNITVFRINPDNGMVTYTGQELKMSHPVCLKF